jgi:anti-sigma B factor antagonist
VQVERVDGYAVVALSGELDVGSAPTLRQCLIELNAAGERRLVVDLDGVRNLDELGLGVLLGGALRARLRGGTFALVCSEQRVRELLELSGVDRAVAVHPTLAAALAAETV